LYQAELPLIIKTARHQKGLKNKNYSKFKGTVKALVVTGITATGSYTDEVEVLDLGSPNSKCAPLPRYPFMTMGTFGGLAYQTTPMICSGKDISAKVCCSLTTTWTAGIKKSLS
jgi:hypothetical protein